MANNITKERHKLKEIINKLNDLHRSIIDNLKLIEVYKNEIVFYFRDATWNESISYGDKTVFEIYETYKTIIKGDIASFQQAYIDLINFSTMYITNTELKHKCLDKFRPLLGEHRDDFYDYEKFDYKSLYTAMNLNSLFNVSHCF